MTDEVTHADLLSRLQRLETIVWLLLGVNVPQLGMLIA